MLIPYNSTTKGFSIIEVIIFIAILSIVLVAAIGFTIRMIISVRINEHRLRATHYVEEVKEWLDGERESDWEYFESYASVAGTVYCINQPLTLSDTLASLTPGACTSQGLTPPIYQRQLSLQKDSALTATRITASIQVLWKDDGAQYIEQIETAYSIWE